MSKFLVFSLLILAIFLAAPTVKGDVNFTLKGVTKKSYRDFLIRFRAALPLESRQFFGIPVLPRSVTGAGRYRQVHLTDIDGNSITLAIDVINVYVLGLVTSKCNVAHFFNDSYANESKRFVFTNARMQITFPFDGSYSQLEKAGGDRDTQDLGLVSMNFAIGKLFDYGCPNSKLRPSDAAKACVVIIQTVPEASRFQKIENAVQRNRPPTLEIQSLQNNWGGLSKQVQLADPTTGRFRANVTLTNEVGRLVNVSDVHSPYVIGNIQLLLNERNA